MPGQTPPPAPLPARLTLDAITPKTLRELATSKMFVNLDVDRTHVVGTIARRLNRTWTVSGFTQFMYGSRDWTAGARLTGRW
jgi:hypothetical protein